ncbi:hypothetical protein [Niveispirillum cyanobacteriorum]|uniref:Uncharacterized protein n=1 Tax=Niveispirillum cyanobacteriorum TaxID=1612173 RepID=A0A2K9NFR5_9PROT|nr:hypothetical protein [Niveispirillum cyanobacteriorum]AUN31970.1 hypothetical protein C0V82_16200 [Niveispirillum cyanobacteriorum]GGE85314.1 hypothetical protein GCM10011317_48150 [Niveispirillum cyanobacteriorum]
MTHDAQVSRRAFLGGAASVAAMAFIPAPPAPAAVPVVEVAPAVATAKPMFGFSTHGGVWEIDFPTRDAALKAAREYHGDDDSFEVGEVRRIRMHVHGELNEAAADALINGGEVFDHLTAYLADCNQDADFEGELSEAFTRAWIADHEDMDAQCRAAISAAIVRAGDPILATQVAVSDPRKHDLSDEIFEALASDDTLQADLHRIITAWVDKHDLWEAGHALSTSNVEKHFAIMPAPEVPA